MAGQAVRDCRTIQWGAQDREHEPQLSSEDWPQPRPTKIPLDFAPRAWTSTAPAMPRHNPPWQPGRPFAHWIIAPRRCEADHNRAHHLAVVRTLILCSGAKGHGRLSRVVGPSLELVVNFRRLINFTWIAIDKLFNSRTGADPPKVAGRPHFVT